MAEETKWRILDAAEELLAAEGYTSTSHRRVASAAEVNLASVRYHFGSKRDLFLAVLKRRLGPLDDERLQNLRKLTREGTVTIKGVVAALVEPMFNLAANPDHGPRVLQLFGRARVEPGEHWQAACELQDRLLRESARALRVCRPDLELRTIRFLVSFFLGSISMALLDEPTLRILGATAAEPDRALEELRARLERAFVDSLNGATSSRRGTGRSGSRATRSREDAGRVRVMTRRRSSVGRLVLCLGVLGAVSGGVIGQEWGSFRGPGARGVRDDAEPPLRWNAESGEGVAWRLPIPGLAHSSPIAWGDQVFVNTAVVSEAEPVFGFATSGRAVTSDESVVEWKIYCVAAETGDVVWEKVLATGVPRTGRHQRSSLCNATPATNGNVVVAVMGSQGLFCMGMDGDLLWSRDLGVLDGGYVGRPEFQWGHASSPILFEDLVIVQVDKFEGSYLAAFRLGTGEQVWRVSRDELPTWCTPTVYESEERAELITNGGRYARAYDPSTGRELWRFRDGAEVKVPTPFAIDGVVYLAGGAPQGRNMLAIRTGGNGDVSDTARSSGHLVWRIQSGGPYTVTPLVYAGNFYTCTNNGTIACHDAQTGRRIYRQRLGVGFSSSPIAAGGRIYLASEEGDVFVIKPGAEFELLARNEMGEPCMATPAISEDRLIIRTTEALYAIEGE